MKQKLIDNLLKRKSKFGFFDFLKLYFIMFHRLDKISIIDVQGIIRNIAFLEKEFPCSKLLVIFLKNCLQSKDQLVVDLTLDLLCTLIENDIHKKWFSPSETSQLRCEVICVYADVFENGRKFIGVMDKIEFAKTYSKLMDNYK